MQRGSKKKALIPAYLSRHINVFPYLLILSKLVKTIYTLYMLYYTLYICIIRLSLRKPAHIIHIQMHDAKPDHCTTSHQAF